MSGSLLPKAAPLNVPQTLAQAVALHQQGRLADAERLYSAILAVRPDHFDALHLLGVVKFSSGQFAEALQLIAAAMRARKPSPEVLLHHGLVLNALNRREEAVESFDRAIKQKSKFAEAHNNRGAVLDALGRKEEALESYNKALAIAPNYADALSNRGNTLYALQRFEEALKNYDRAVALRPDFAEAHYNRGNTLRELRRPDEALLGYERSLALRPTFVEAICNQGAALYELKRYDEGLQSCERAITVRPDYAEAHYNRGLILHALQRHDEALQCYDRALALRANFFEALCNRGNALREMKRYDEAVASYDRALAIQPDHSETLCNRGVALHELKRFDEALQHYEHALATRPDFIDALSNRSETLRELRRYDEALASYEILLRHKPDHEHALSGLAACVINLCDWQRRAQLLPEVEAHVASKRSVMSPFILFGYSGDPALQLQCAASYTEHCLPFPPQPLWTGQRWKHEKLRIAYLSADFRAHATAFLMAGLFERHDRHRFQIVGVSFGHDDGSATRKRLVAAFDEFHDVSGKSDAEVAKLVAERQIDIAIDLKGHTQEARPDIFACRPAPIQVSYLGYPGSMGARFIDYVIADKVVAPFEHQPFFSEKIVHLPDCYQVNDSKRKIAEHLPTRSDAGLPERGFVFCCFNNNWKITPEVFDVWMRLLGEVDGSVLWLLRDNDTAMRNLRAEAQRRGVDPARIVFAERMQPDAHLARHRLADLFLDTLPCNAHTTASDALWTGLPVLTCLGEAFAGRVAASLLHGAGVPELIAGNLPEYQALALRLARDPAQLASLAGKLRQNRDGCALFNTERFARHIEAAYITMCETWQRGEPPASFAVPPIA